MKISTLYAFCAALLMCFSCEKIDIPKADEANNYNLVYIPAAVTPIKKTMAYKDTVYALTFGAAYGGGEHYPTNAIQVDFEVSTDSVDAYNRKNNTTYEILPVSAYELSTVSATIEPGTLATKPLSLSVNPIKGLELFKTYLLPISLKQITGDARINTRLATAYFLLTPSLNLADFDDFDRTDWSIIGKSSEETEGEPAANGGHAIHAIDNSLTTFWHTRWSGGNAPPPHYLEIDMGDIKTVHGISLAARNSDRGRPQEVKVEIRNDATEEWKSIGYIPLNKNAGSQRIFFTKSYECKQFKVTIVKIYDNYQFTNLTNLNMF